MIVKITIFIGAMIVLTQLIIRSPGFIWKIDLRWAFSKGTCPYCSTKLLVVDDGGYTIFHCHKCKFKLSDQSKAHHQIGVYDSYHQHGFRPENGGS